MWGFLICKQINPSNSQLFKELELRIYIKTFIEYSVMDCNGSARKRLVISTAMSVAMKSEPIIDAP